VSKKRQGTATIYPVDERCSIIAPDSSRGYYQILAFKVEDWADLIDRRVLEIGEYRFVPGEQYSKFGKTKKTSAGFISYDGEPLTFVGVFEEHALFTRGDSPFSHGDFVACFWSWIYSTDPPAFFATTAQRSGRAMEL
jgi:hypothetical protein